MAAVDPPLVVKPVILKNLYRNGKKVPMMFRNGDLIYQMLQKLVFEVDTEYIRFLPSGGTQTITITANDDWTMTLPNWITASQISGTSNATVTITAQATDTEKEGDIVISCGSKEHTISVRQISLPAKSFLFNYNARNYNSSTRTIVNESNASLNRDMVLSGTSSSVINNITLVDDHISIPLSAYSLFEFSTSGANPINNTVEAPAMTIIIKFKPNNTSSGSNLICNRDNSTFNYMVRANENGNGALSLSTLGGTILGPTFTTGSTVIGVWRVNQNRAIDIKNLTDKTSSQPTTSTWNSGSKWFSFFMRKRTTSASDWNEPMACDFYWCYASKEYLTDAEVQQVVDFNEN